MDRRPAWLGRVLAAAAVLAVLAASWGLYRLSRPELATPGQAQRRTHVRAALDSLRYSEEGRAAIALVREYFLDYPATEDAGLRLQAVSLAASVPAADFGFVAEAVEQSARKVLAAEPPGQLPTRKAWERAGFGFSEVSDYYGWADAPIAADLDGDGRKDLVLAYPGATSPGACLLFRNTETGWVSNRIAVGARVLGLYPVRISPALPTAIALCSLEGSSYLPNLFFDLFVWRGGRLENVLSTRIRNGWQWDSNDLDGDGVNELRLFESRAPRSWQDRDRRGPYTVYRWDGRRFRRGRGAVPEDLPQASVRGGVESVLFEQGDYEKAVRELAKPAEYSDWSRPYYLALSRAMLGDRQGSVDAMARARTEYDREQQQSGGFRFNSRGEGFKPRFDEFLAACASPAGLPDALARTGQIFRVIEHAESAAPGAGLVELLSGSSARIERIREAPFLGQGGQVAQIRWSGGSAVMAHLPASAGGAPKLRVLAYGLELPPAGLSYSVEYRDLFYLPGPVAVQLYPIARSVRLVDLRGGDRPRVVVSYVQWGTEQAALEWNGSAFIREGEGGVPREDPHSALNRAESLLFEAQQYPEAVARFEALAAEIRQAPVPPETRSELLRELYYHEAIAERKLGHGSRAAGLLSAIWRDAPDSAWGRIARRWLGP